MSQQRKNIAIPLLTVFFITVMIILFLNGGMCERYERKMERQRHMRSYIDSMRRVKELQKLDQPKQDSAPDQR
ncbi:MAG TPA: hypothetical protein DIS79_04725 [Bacteroidetes bacterium]|nr:hypothetical protein [Bacteroidota bacterium]HRK04355.1 hypothetical protein [Chlorobiota bacterium]